MFFNTSIVPADDATLAQLADRFRLIRSGVTPGGMAQRVAGAILNGPAELDEQRVAALVPDADLGLAENGFMMMLFGSGLRSSGPYVGSFRDNLRPACYAVPKDQGGDLNFEASRFLVAVSDTECAVFDPAGAFLSFQTLSQIEDLLGKSGSKISVMDIPAEAIPWDRKIATPLHRRPLEEIVPADERPITAAAWTMARIVSHPGFCDEADLRRKCHVREFACNATGVRMFSVVDRYDRAGAPDRVSVPYLWLMAPQADGSLAIVGGRMGMGLYIEPAYRGLGLGAELCLAAHDDPVLHSRGALYNRTIGSHKAWRAAHRLAVERALEQGFDVPPVVLADYPDLGEPAPAL